MNQHILDTTEIFVMMPVQVLMIVEKSSSPGLEASLDAKRHGCGCVAGYCVQDEVHPVHAKVKLVSTVKDSTFQAAWQFVWPNC